MWLHRCVVRGCSRSHQGARPNKGSLCVTRSITHSWHTRTVGVASGMEGLPALNSQCADNSGCFFACQTIWMFVDL